MIDKQKKTTLKDIAKKSGVSISTVSMVLRGDGNISTEVSSKILTIAKELGYQRKEPKDTIRPPVYITLIEYESFDYQWNFIKPFILAISQELRKSNIHTIFYHLDRKHPDLEDLMASVKNSNSKVVCSIQYFNEAFFDRLKKELSVNVVLLNNSVYQEKFSAVCVDDFQGMYNGASFLINKGHKNFLYFDYTRTELSAIVADRYLGFQKAILENNIDFNEDKQRVTIQLENLAQNRAIIKNRLEEYPSTTAIVFHDDYQASWGLPIIQELGYNIPNDISVIAPGDTLDFHQPFSPKLTTIQIDTARMGRMAADLIKKHLSDPLDVYPSVKVIPHIFERQSCKTIESTE